MVKATHFKFGTQTDYKEYFGTGDIEKLAAFDMHRYRWILSTKILKPMHAGAHGHRDRLSKCGEQKKAPAYQPRGQSPDVSSVSRLWKQLNRWESYRKPTTTRNNFHTAM